MLTRRCRYFEATSRAFAMRWQLATRSNRNSPGIVAGMPCSTTRLLSSAMHRRMTSSAIESMHAASSPGLFSPSFTKYDTSDDGKPSMERRVSKSCSVNKKMTCAAFKCRISWERIGMYRSNSSRCFAMAWGTRNQLPSSRRKIDEPQQRNRAV